MSGKITHIAEGLRRRWKRKGYDPQRHDYDAGVEKAKDVLARRVAVSARSAAQTRHKESGCPPDELLVLRRKRQDWIDCPVCGWGTDRELFAQWHPERYAAIVAAHGEPATWPKRRPSRRA